MASMTQDYAMTAYRSAQTQTLTPLDAFLQLYDFAIAGCVAQDTRKASAALVELVAALNFDYEDIAAGLYRLYEYCLREVKAQRFEPALKILRELRDTWHAALGRSGGLGEGG
jgi:flagellar protein FliS